MLNQQSIDNFIDHLTVNGASANTLRAYRADLEQACEWIILHPRNWYEMEGALATYLTHHRSQWAPKTVQRKLGTFRSWGKWNGAPDTFLSKYKAPKPAPPQPHPIPEGIDGVKAMIARTRNSQHKALCALTGLLGLRVGEAITVRPCDFNVSEMTLTVRGKGDKTRVVPVSDYAWQCIRLQYSKRIVGDGRRSFDAGYQLPLVSLTNRGARKAITRHAKNAGLSRHVASHDMRATFATAAYQKSKDLRAVQELLGHASSVQTQVYTGVSMSTMREAADVS